MMSICKHGWDEGPGYQNKCLDCEDERKYVRVGGGNRTYTEEELTAMSGDCVKCRQYKKRIAELEARLDAVNNIKYETHPSWNCSDDFNSGWKACRELVRDMQALEQKE